MSCQQYVVHAQDSADLSKERIHDEKDADNLSEINRKLAKVGEAQESVDDTI